MRTSGGYAAGRAKRRMKYSREGVDLLYHGFRVVNSL